MSRASYPTGVSDERWEVLRDLVLAPKPGPGRDLIGSTRDRERPVVCRAFWNSVEDDAARLAEWVDGLRGLSTVAGQRRARPEHGVAPPKTEKGRVRRPAAANGQRQRDGAAHRPSPGTTESICSTASTMGGRTDFRMAWTLEAPFEMLRTGARVNPSNAAIGVDPTHAAAIRMISCECTPAPSQQSRCPRGRTIRSVSMIRAWAPMVTMALFASPSAASAQTADTEQARGERSPSRLPPAAQPAPTSGDQPPSRVAPILLGALGSAVLGAAGGYAGYVAAATTSSLWYSRDWRAGWAILGGVSATSAALGMLAVDAVFGFRGQGWSPFAGAALSFSIIMVSAAIEHSGRGRVTFETFIVGSISNPLFTVLANELWVLLRPHDRPRAARPVALFSMASMQPDGASFAIGGSW